jgi:hypothetical protein
MLYASVGEFVLDEVITCIQLAEVNPKPFKLNPEPACSVASQKVSRL